MNKVIKKGLSITKVIVWNKTGTEAYDEATQCELTFSDGSSIMYECKEINELKNQNKGIYELLDDGTYIQIENWE